MKWVRQVLRAEMLHIFVEFQCLLCFGRRKKDKQIEFWMECSNPLYKCYSFRALNAYRTVMLDAATRFIYCEKFLLLAFIPGAHKKVPCVFLVCANILNAYACLFSVLAFQFHFFCFNLNWLNSFYQNTHLVVLMCIHENGICALSRIVVYGLVWFYASFAS